MTKNTQERNQMQMGKTQRSIRQCFSPYLSRIFGNGLWLGVNDSIWKVGFELFPNLPYGFLTLGSRNLPLELMTGM